MTSKSGSKGKEEVNSALIDDDEELNEMRDLIVQAFLLWIHWMRMMMILEKMT